MKRATTPPSNSTAPDKEDGPLDVQRIVSATRRIVESSGLESVTMRRVASELGVSAMGLYHHVSDKRALLALVADDVMGSVDFPGPETGPWHQRIRQNMLRVHEEVARYPGLGLYIWSANGLYPTYPKGYGQIRSGLEVLIEAGFDKREAMSAMHLLSAYEGGYFMVEREAQAALRQSSRSPEPTEGLHDYSPASPAMVSSTEVYQEGLETIITGLRAQLAAKQVLINSSTG